MAEDAHKNMLEVAKEPGGITLPKWFVWLVSMFTVFMVPAFGAVATFAYNIRADTAEMKVDIRYMRDDGAERTLRLDRVESRLDAHMSDPTIHKYELDRIRSELRLLELRIESMEDDSARTN